MIGVGGCLRRPLEDPSLCLGYDGYAVHCGLQQYYVPWHNDRTAVDVELDEQLSIIYHVVERT